MCGLLPLIVFGGFVPVVILGALPHLLFLEALPLSRSVPAPEFLGQDGNQVAWNSPYLPF